MVTGRVRTSVSCLDEGRRTRARKGAFEDIADNDTIKGMEVL